MFADVPHPGDDGIIGTPEHVEVCGECGDLRAALGGRRWRELADDESSSAYVSQAISFYTAGGWQYYLPAYLIQSIRRGRFSSLYFRPTSDPGLVEYQEERVGRLTPDQCRVVIAYLLVVLKEDRSCQYEVERHAEAVRYWKENYRMAAARRRRSI